MGVTLAEKRLQVIAGTVGKLADAVRLYVDNGQPLDNEMTEKLAVELDAVRVYAQMQDVEPESRRVYNGLRVVQ